MGKTTGLYSHENDLEEEGGVMVRTSRWTEMGYRHLCYKYEVISATVKEGGGDKDISSEGRCLFSPDDFLVGKKVVNVGQDRKKVKPTL